MVTDVDMDELEYEDVEDAVPKDNETIHAFLEAPSGCLTRFTRKHTMWLDARGFWNDNISQDLQKIPQNFLQTGLTMCKKFRSIMERDYPELRLCADHWKADQVWKLNYHSWKGPVIARLEVEEAKAKAKADAEAGQARVNTGIKHKQAEDNNSSDDGPRVSKNVKSNKQVQFLQLGTCVDL